LKTVCAIEVRSDRLHGDEANEKRYQLSQQAADRTSHEDINGKESLKDQERRNDPLTDPTSLQIENLNSESLYILKIDLL
jgi:hypothetical protein